MVKFASSRKRGRRTGPKAKALGRRRKANIKARKTRLSTLAPGRALRSVTSMTGLITNSVTSFGKAKRLSKGLSRLGAPCHYVVNSHGSRIPDASTPSGRQDCVLLGQWNSVQDVFNASLLVPTSAVASATGKTPTRFHMKSIQAEQTLQNPTSVTMIYDLYDVVARKDIPNSNSTGPAQGTAVYDPISAWVSGMYNQNNTAIMPGFPDPINILGAKPTDSQLFNDYYRVVKKTSLVLQQNSTHVHKVNLTMDKNFDLNEIITQVAYLNGIANFTFYTFAVMRGLPVVTPGSESNLGTTTVPPHLRWVNSEHYQFSWLQSQGNEFLYQYDMAGAINGAINALQLNNPTVGSVIVA